MDFISVTYDTIKQVIGKIPSYYVVQGDDGYIIYTVGDNICASYQIFGHETEIINDFEINYKSMCSSVGSGDDAYLLGVIANKIPLVNLRTSDGRIRLAAEKSVASRTNFYSHNWCDPTTWYQQSIYVSDEVPTSDGYYTVYTLAHNPVIDTYHGKITLEDSLKDSNNRSYRVSITVDGYAKVEQDPHYGTGGDYTIDYANGTITFLSALSAENVVNVNYHYANITGNGLASRFTMVPAPGKKISVQMAEAQFSTDVVLNDTTMFEVWGIADYFLTSSQMAAFGIPAGIGYKIMLQQFKYKTFNDFQNDAFRTYPTMAAIGGNNWRSQPVPLTVMDWDYIASTYLHSNWGMEIRAYLEHDVPMSGWMCTVTFYCASENEP